MRRCSVFFCVFFAVAWTCTGCQQSQHKPEAAMSRAEMSRRPTPLREEIDQVAPVQEKFRKVTGQDEH